MRKRFCVPICYNKQYVQRATIYFPCGILIIAIFLRFYHFTSTPPDSIPRGNGWQQRREVVETGTLPHSTSKTMVAKALCKPRRAILKVMLLEAWVIRLPAAIAGVLTVVGIYYLVASSLARQDFSPHFCWQQFWHINFSRIGFRAIPPTSFNVGAVSIDKGFRAISARARGGCDSRRVVYGLGFYTYIAIASRAPLFALYPVLRKNPASEVDGCFFLSSHFWSPRQSTTISSTSADFFGAPRRFP